MKKEAAIETALGSAETRNQFELELQQLRRQLETFNEEEQKVMQELEVTKTLRKAYEDGQSQDLS